MRHLRVPRTNRLPPLLLGLALLGVIATAGAAGGEQVEVSADGGEEPRIDEGGEEPRIDEGGEEPRIDDGGGEPGRDDEKPDGAHVCNVTVSVQLADLTGAAGLDVYVTGDEFDPVYGNVTDGEGRAGFVLPYGNFTLFIVHRGTPFPAELTAIEPGDAVSAGGRFSTAGCGTPEVTVVLPESFSQDSDGDGGYDWWEEANGLDPQDPGDATFGDGTGWPPLLGGGIPEDGTPGNDTGDEGEEPWYVTWMPYLAAGAVVLLLALAGYSKLRRDRILEHATRNEIYNYIRRQPGTHLRGIQKDLDLPLGVLNHHLRQLEMVELIKSRPERQYRRYYPYYYKAGGSPMLSKGQRAVYNTVAENPGITPQKAALLLSKTSRNVYYHVRALEEMGLVRTEKSGKETRCYLAGGS